MKKLATVTTHRQRDDGSQEDQLTQFYYDLTGRPQNTYLPDNSNEYSTYEFGQLKTWKTRKNQTKTIVYDARGRELSHTWNDGVTPGISRSWDDANRLASVTNIFSSIDFGYDDAGQVLWEGDEIAGSGGRTQTNYYRYPNGSVAHLHYPGGTFIRNDYTSRGQLAATGWDDDDSNWWLKLAAYSYRADYKVDHTDYGNGMRSALGYDDRGFIQIVDHYHIGALDYSWRQYWRDSRDRITAFQKNYNPGSNPMENGRGDRFRYDDEGQLVEAWYNATDPANSGNGNTRYDYFDFDALGNRRGSDYIASRGQWMNFTRKDNGLNQYHAWFPYSFVNYDDDIGGTWGSPGNANGVIMQDGWITGGYNALNQPMYITSPTYYGTANWMYLAYDPLGRCVKRWVGESGDIYSNPATYYHYDGWNLLQEGANAWGPARVYAHGNRVDEIVWSYNTGTGEQAYHHYDARGHCTLLTDSSGNILEQYEYDGFGCPYFYDANGNAVGAYDSVQNLWEGYSLFGNRFLFTGREWIPDLKLYDYRNRLYQPELGRFLQPDSEQFAAGDYNLYRYCHNDPINKYDPLGLDGNIIAEVQELKKVTGYNIPQWVTTAKLTTTFSGNNWKDAGKAAAAVAVAAAHTTGSEYFGIVVRSPNDGKYYATKPIQGFYEYVPRRHGWFNTSDFARLRVAGFDKVAGYWALAQSEKDWPTGDKKALFQLGLNGVLGVPSPNGAQNHPPDFRYFTYDPNHPPKDNE